MNITTRDGAASAIQIKERAIIKGFAGRRARL